MLIRQPNGKICICSWDGTVERMNLTEDEYTAYCIGLAKEEIKKNLDGILDFGRLVAKQKVTDGQLKEMGSGKPLSELIKFAPRKPLNTQYVPINFEIQGICPHCGEVVIKRMGKTNEKCKCGQFLKWN